MGRESAWRAHLAVLGLIFVMSLPPERVETKRLWANDSLEAAVCISPVLS